MFKMMISNLINNIMKEMNYLSYINVNSQKNTFLGMSKILKKIT